MRVITGGLTDARVIALLEHHVRTAASHTEPGSAHAFDVRALAADDVDFFSIWADDANQGTLTDLLGTAAIKGLTPRHAELKSMHVAKAARGQGAGSAILTHVLEHAKRAGFDEISLETGSWPYFDAAHRLYARHGFVECAPFGAYKLDPNSVFMTRRL